MLLLLLLLLLLLRFSPRNSIPPAVLSYLYLLPLKSYNKNFAGSLCIKHKLRKIIAKFWNSQHLIRMHVQITQHLQLSSQACMHWVQKGNEQAREEISRVLAKDLVYFQFPEPLRAMPKDLYMLYINVFGHSSKGLWSLVKPWGALAIGR